MQGQAFLQRSFHRGMKRAGVSILLGPFRDVLPALACVDRLRIERAIHRGHRVGKRVLLTHTAVSPRLTVRVSGKISASDEAAMRRRPKAILMLADTERDELSTINRRDEQAEGRY